MSLRIEADPLTETTLWLNFSPDICGQMVQRPVYGMPQPSIQAKHSPYSFPTIEEARVTDNVEIVAILGASAGDVITMTQRVATWTESQIVPIVICSTDSLRQSKVHTSR